ncbi:MAG: ParA family protein [Burkholderiales bacterium]
MRTILVINSKGGCGKTTVTTTLASYYASTGAKVAIMDYDQQGSSLQWLKMRPTQLPRIHGANAVRQPDQPVRSRQMWVPSDTDLLLVDAPGGVKGILLQELLARAELVIVPVAPSSIDIHATANFLKELLVLGKVRTRNIKVGVVANRVRSAMPVYEPLERFLTSLGLPLLARVRDSDAFIIAAESGLGIFELDADAGTQERQEFLPVIKWVDSHFAPNGVNAKSNIVQIADARRMAVV